MDTLSLDKLVDIKDASEKLYGPGVSGRSFKQGFDEGFVISIVYEGHWSSLSFAAKYIGDELSYPTIITILIFSALIQINYIYYKSIKDFTFELNKGIQVVITKPFQFFSSSIFCLPLILYHKSKHRSYK
ncbi:hypothetical protein MFLAVUS_002163 [Mucor flavus]|uniref:Uncharacterized protein n=1 Tax=Mucor flavus TaxID=439312 RepID=A0ABP9YPH9_9FUNG